LDNPLPPEPWQQSQGKRLPQDLYDCTKTTLQALAALQGGFRLIGSSGKQVGFPEKETAHAGA